ncbi:protein kinase [Candidatus Obscuribacterales bacterium]|jgi:serine/threonine protein kinase|nr:protein kinase [Candidatus Obscuribacterales bacterium]
MFSGSNSEFPVELLGRYQLIGPIGKGAMGTVYRALDVSLSKEVAIKTLLTGSSDRKRMMRFQKEAKAIGSLNHPNLVGIMDFGVTNLGTAYMVMEFIDGIPLNAFLSDERASDLSVMLSIFQQVCDAVAHAHRHGIIHRDIKSSNVMLEHLDSVCPTARVIDFGIAHLCNPDERSGLDTTSGKIQGSPAYMSPESSRGEGDGRSDIYSLGCLLFECLTGRVPFEAESVMLMMKKHAEEKPPELADFAKVDDVESTQKLQEVVSRCLAKEPAARYQTVEELVTHINEIVDSLPQVTIKTVASPETTPIIPDYANQFLGSRILQSRTRVGVFVLLMLSSIAALLFFSLQNLNSQAARVDHDFTTIDPASKIPVPMMETVFTRAVRGDDTISDERIKAGIPVPDRRAYLYGQAPITDEGLRALLVKHRPVILDLSFTDVSEKGLLLLGKCKDLQQLNLSGLPVTTAVLEQLSASAISTLVLSSTKVDSTGIRAIAKMPELITLKLDSCPNVTDEGMSYLKNKPLSSLSVKFCRISPAVLCDIPELVRLDMDRVPCRDEDVKLLSKLPKLRMLQLVGAEITPTALTYLEEIPTLTLLCIADCPGLSKADFKKFETRFNRRHRFRLGLEDELPFQGPRTFSAANSETVVNQSTPNEFVSR